MKVDTTLFLRRDYPLDIVSAVQNGSGDVRLVLSNAERKRLSKHVGFPVWRVLLVEYDLRIFLIAERRGADRLTSFPDYEENSRCYSVADQTAAMRLYVQVTEDKELEAIFERGTRHAERIRYHGNKYHPVS